MNSADLIVCKAMDDPKMGLINGVQSISVDKTDISR